MAPQKRKREEEENDSEGEGDEELMMEMRALRRPANSSAQPAVNNKPALLAALAEIRQDLPWIERLEVVSAEPASIKNVNDDLQVELAFYGHALAAVVASRAELDRLGVPHRRPTDYFAQMLKSDSHMLKIKDKLLLEKQKIVAVEHRRKDKEAATINKETQAERLKQKQADKKSSLAAVAAWRKDGTGSKMDLNSDKDLDKLFKGGMQAPGQGQGQAGRSEREVRAAKGKRAAKDGKYGHGGKKEQYKKNSKDSSASMSGYSVKRMKSGSSAPNTKTRGGQRGPKGSKGGKRAKKTGADRPGKDARKKSRKA